MTYAAPSALQSRPPLASTARRSGRRLSPRDPQPLSEHRLRAKPLHPTLGQASASVFQPATPASAKLTDAGSGAPLTIKSP